MTRLAVLASLLLGIMGCVSLVEKPCSLRDKELVQYWYVLRQEHGNTTDGRTLADKFLMKAIEQDVPVHCWRDRS